MPELLTIDQVAERLGVTRGMLAQWRYLGTGPRFVKLSARTVRYTSTAIDEWIEANTRQGTAA